MATPTNRVHSIDWHRVGEYLLGRSTLIGVASLMLLVISGYATWHGMRDFIVGVSAAPTDTQGGLSVPNDVLVVIVVAALTFLMWLALRETFGSHRRLTERLITIPLYLFLAVWSIGFGYGFWWSLIAGEEATRTGLSGLQEDARDSSAVIAARLDAVRAQLDNVVTWSESQMAREESSGGSCGTTSGAGRGRLYNARRGVRDSVASLRDGVTRSWLEPMQSDVEKLRQSAAQIEGTTVEDRQRRFEARATEIRGQARSIAARSNELGKSTAQEMRALAGAVAIAPGQAGFSCFDPTLSQRLTNAAGQAEVPATLTLREAAFSEGPAGVANAVKKLWENIGLYLAGSVRYLFSGGSTAGTTKSGDPITGRDLIALLATIGIDLGLLALAALNPPPAAPGRRDGLSRSQALLRLPTSAVVRQITAAIETAIENAPGTNLDWARRHFIHHRACSYLVIPNIYSVDPADKDEQLRALAINQLAGVLDDLNLIRVLSSQELKKLAKDETRGSFADLLPLRHQHDRERTQPGNGQLGWKEWVLTKAGMNGLPNDENRLRYHGLLSKAQRLLEIAGWSEAAQRDAEVYRLVDCDGLTPLLALFSEASLAKGAESIALARAEHQALANQLPLRLEDRR